MRARDENKELRLKTEALKMIAKDGLEQFSIQKLAKKAAVSPATIYIYFKDKEDLILKLCQEAMEKIKQVQTNTVAKPALVLLDLVLPDINGLEILCALKNHPATQDIPVFILSNYSSDALHSMTAIKPEKYLVKANISPTQLVELVQEQLGKKT